MTNSDPRVLVRDIVGQLCEGATNPYGSILTLELGTLSQRLSSTEPGELYGWRQLTVLSPWRLQTETAVLCDWNCEGGANGTINPVIEQLKGEHVVTAETAPPGWDLRIHWSNGLSLVVFGDSTDDREDAWFILGTDGAEAGAVPVLRDVSRGIGT